MSRVLVSLTVLLAALAVAAAAPAAPTKTTVLRLTAQGTALKFDKKTLRARAGKVSLVFTNRASMPHNVAVKGKGVRKLGKVVGRGGVSKVTVTLKKGKYRFFCSVPGHEAAGMWGTLTVR